VTGAAETSFDYDGALRRCASGDSQALQAIYAVEAGRLLGVVLRIVRRREVAEEIVQDAFVQIWRRAASFDGRLGSGRTWIYAIARNRALNVIRDGAREDIADAETIAAASDKAHVAEAAFEKLDPMARLHGCLNGLDEKKRSSILLAYVAGFTHGEIAGRLGVPLGTAKAWVRRGILALKECMA
jgi:RNA polymerase sigma-70 factor (ECF subfamily)